MKSNRDIAIYVGSILMLAILIFGLLMLVKAGVNAIPTPCHTAPSTSRSTEKESRSSLADDKQYHETTVTLSVSHNESVFMTPVTWTARVKAKSDTVPQDTVQFITTSPDGKLSAIIGYAELKNGVATFTKKQFVPGVHPVYAVYLGDWDHRRSQSNTTVLTVTNGSDRTSAEAGSNTRSTAKAE